MVVKPTLLYGAECWPVKNAKCSKGEGRRDENAQMDVQTLGETGLGTKLYRTRWQWPQWRQTARLRWFEHVKRRFLETPVRR